MRFLYIIWQLGIFILFVILASLRLLGKNSDFALIVGTSSVPISFLIILNTAKNKISNSKKVWDEKKKHRSNLIEILIAVFVILSILYVCFAFFHTGIKTKWADFSSILALGMSLANDFLATIVSSIFLINGPQRKKQSVKITA